MANCCENGSETSGATKYWELLDWFGDCTILKNDSAPWSRLAS